MRSKERLRKLEALKRFYETTTIWGFSKRMVALSYDYPTYDVFKDGRFAEVDFHGRVVWCKCWDREKQEIVICEDVKEAARCYGEVDEWIDTLLKRTGLHHEF